MLKPQHSGIARTPRVNWPRSPEKENPSARWRLIASESFADTHPECVTAHALGDISPKIDVVLFA
jgi:hypothetical protein